MNNIIIDKNCYLEVEEDLSLIIKNDLNITLFINNKETNLDIKIDKNTISTINIFNIDSSCDIKIVLKEESKLYLNNSIINNNNLNMNISIDHNKYAHSDIVNHGINVNDGSMIFNIDSIINKGMISTLSKQDNKIINFSNGNSAIRPNLLIEEFDSYANHSAYISKFNNEELFYIQSRGISLDNCKYLLTKSFLLSRMELDNEVESMFTEKILNIKERG